MRADYHHYVKELADAHTERALYIALPAVLYRIARSSRHWTPLLDTIALADAHGLDTNTLIAAISTDNYNDLGASLLIAPDPARELQTRADAWIHQHHPDADFTDDAMSFHALTDLPYTEQLRPIPNHPHQDERLTDFAHELRRRIEQAQPEPPTTSRTPTTPQNRQSNTPPPAVDPSTPVAGGRPKPTRQRRVSVPRPTARRSRRL